MEGFATAHAVASGVTRWDTKAGHPVQHRERDPALKRHRLHQRPAPNAGHAGGRHTPHRRPPPRRRALALAPSASPSTAAVSRHPPGRAAPAGRTPRRAGTVPGALLPLVRHTAVHVRPLPSQGHIRCSSVGRVTSGRRRSAFSGVWAVATWTGGPGTFTARRWWKATTRLGPRGRPTFMTMRRSAQQAACNRSSRASLSDRCHSANRDCRFTTTGSWVLRAITTTASSSGSGFSSRCATYGGT